MSSTTPAPNTSSAHKPFKRKLALRAIIFVLTSLAIIYGTLFIKNKIYGDQTSTNIEKNEGDDLLELDPNTNNSIDIEEMKAGEISEKGSEFMYQLALKNQSQIDEIKTDLRNLQSDFAKYKNQDNVSKIVLSYVNFREKFFAKSDFKLELQNLEILGAQDVFLRKNFEDFKNLAPDFFSKEELIAEFSRLIPELIAIKSIKSQANKNLSFVENLRYFLAKLIVVRKINSKDLHEIDSVISMVEVNLKRQNYQEALNNLTLLEQKYFTLLHDFIEKLNVAIEAQKADESTLNYLKNLT